MSIVEEKKIDLLIPTCEEVFYIAKIKKEIPSRCCVFCSDIRTLEKLHNKQTFADFIRGFPLQTPDTRAWDPALFDDPQFDPRQWVFKPIYSRFGNETLISPDRQKLLACMASSNKKWVMQKCIQGQELCAYAVAVHGIVTAQVTYVPVYRYNTGSSIYFQSVHIPCIEAFVQRVVKTLNFTGQIAFDLIKRGEHFFVLECNPRGTSGIHLLADDPLLLQAFTSSQCHITCREVRRKALVLPVLMLHGFSKLFSRNFKKFFNEIFRSKDIVFDATDKKPSLLQFYIIIFFLLKSLLTGKSIKSLTTQDIEWDGD